MVKVIEKVVLFVFACAAATSASTINFFSLPTPNTEVVYHYLAEVKSGVPRPTLATDFILNADIHIVPEKDEKKIFVSFKNQRIQLNNGEKHFYTKYINESKYFSIPDESQTFFTPFVIEYHNDGNYVKAIFTQKGEPLWVLNIKKSIASVLQFDWTQFNSNKQNSTFLYHSEEETLYGNCNVTFFGKPKVKGYAVEKVYDPFSCSRFEPDLHSTVAFVESGEMRTSHMAMEHFRHYSLTESGEDHFLIDKILAAQHFIIYPFRDSTQVFYVNTNQTFIYQSTLTSTVTFDDSSIDFKTPHSLVFEKPDFDVKGRYPDYSLGRSVMDRKSQMDKLNKLIHGAVEYLEEDNLEEPNRKAISEIVAILRRFDLGDFQYCLANLRGEMESDNRQMIDLFFKIVPFVGSGASALFIKDLIKSKKVDDDISESMLIALGTNLRVVSPELLTSLDELIHLELKPDVKKVAMLAFSTIIYKTFKSDPSSQILAKYVVQFYSLLKNSKTYEDQMLYVQMLGNVKIGKVYKYLIPIAKGDEILSIPYNERLRMHALWALEKSLGSSNPNLLCDIAMFVLKNRELGSDLRIVALQVIFYNGDLTQMMHIGFYMVTETDNIVYNYYYSYLSSLINLEENSQISSSRDAAAHMQKYALFKRSDLPTTGFAYETINMEIGTGVFVRGQIVFDKQKYLSHFQADLFHVVFHQKIKLYSIYFKVYDLNKINWINFMDMEHLSPSDLLGELSISYGDEIVCSKVISKTMLTTLFKQVIENPERVITKYLSNSVFFELQADYNFPSDLGTMIQIFAETPQVTQLKFNSDINSMGYAHNIDIGYKLWKKETYGMKVYNPFTAAWQGIYTDASIDFRLPMNYKTSREEDGRIVLERLENVTLQRNLLHFRSHAYTKIFIDEETDRNYLGIRAEDIGDEVIRVTRGPKYVSNYNILRGTMGDLGVDYNLSVFDCEAPPKQKIYHKVTDVLTMKPFSDYFKTSMPDFLTRLYGYLKFEMYYPKMESCGVEFTLKPSKENFARKLEMDSDLGGKTYFKLINDNNNVIVEYRLVSKYISSTLSKEVEFYRFARNESSTSICFEFPGVKTYRNREEIELKMKYGKYYGFKERCVDDGFMVSLKKISELSDAQRKYGNDEYFTYAECLLNAEILEIPPLLPMSRCGLASKQLHKYTKIIDYENVPLEFENFVNTLWNWIHISYPASYSPSLISLTKSNQIVIDAELDMQNEDKFEATVNFGRHSYTFENVDTRYLLLTNPWNHCADKFSLAKTCLVSARSTDQIAHLEHYPNLEDWTLYLIRNETYEGNDYSETISMKKLTDDQMALKITRGNQVIIVEPNRILNSQLGYTNFKITTDESVFSESDYDVHNMEVFTVRDTFFYKAGLWFVSFNGHLASIEYLPLSRQYLSGLCESD